MYRLAIRGLGVAAVLLVSGPTVAQELLLQCNGTVDSFQGPVWTKNDQKISVRLDEHQITFSGNEFLSGQNIKFCTEGEDIYFDSAGCDEKQSAEARRSGVLDRVSMTLNLTNTAKNVGVTGYFNCTEVDGNPGLHL